MLTYLINDRYESRRLGLESLKEKGCDVQIYKVMVSDPNDKDSESVNDTEQMKGVKDETDSD